MKLLAFTFSTTAFMKIVFITIRNVLKRPRLSATERMHLLELLELRTRGWNPDSSTNKCDSRRANNAELFKTPTPPQVQVQINYFFRALVGIQFRYTRASVINEYQYSSEENGGVYRKVNDSLILHSTRF